MEVQRGEDHGGEMAEQEGDLIEVDTPDCELEKEARTRVQRRLRPPQARTPADPWRTRRMEPAPLLNPRMVWGSTGTRRVAGKGADSPGAATLILVDEANNEVDSTRTMDNYFKGLWRPAWLERYRQERDQRRTMGLPQVQEGDEPGDGEEHGQKEESMDKDPDGFLPRDLALPRRPGTLPGATPRDWVWGNTSSWQDNGDGWEGVTTWQHSADEDAADAYSSNNGWSEPGTSSTSTSTTYASSWRQLGRTSTTSTSTETSFCTLWVRSGEVATGVSSFLLAAPFP